MRQRRWIELLKDYDCTIEYHPGKANAVADALSRKSSSNIAHLQVSSLSDLLALRSMNVKLHMDTKGVLTAALKIRPILRDKIQQAQRRDVKLMEIIDKVRQGVDTPFVMQNDMLMLGTRLCVPDVDDLRREILDEAHNASYAMHPGTTKMYHTLRSHYWWLE